MRELHGASREALESIGWGIWRDDRRRVAQIARKLMFVRYSCAFSAEDLSLIQTVSNADEAAEILRRYHRHLGAALHKPPLHGRGAT